jgi:bifunctional DNA-binding transcriptional regulator/antitoxin component of YhaV-PrlF toxin-antitoxin module
MLSTEQMEAIVRPYVTTSDRIRALDAAGVPRAEIARFLGKRYQHVRNVLEGDRQRGLTPAPPVEGVREADQPFQLTIDNPELVQGRGGGAYRLVVRADGSLLLPKEVRDAFGIEGGGVVMAKLDGDTFGLISAKTAMVRIRAMVRKHIPPDVDLAAELIADRRAEAAAEVERE